MTRTHKTEIRRKAAEHAAAAFGESIGATQVRHSTCLAAEVVAMVL